jgi:hypothetical protein
LVKGVFCTKETTQGVESNPAAIASMLRDILPGQDIYVLNQMHSDRIITSEEVPGGKIPDADGIVSRDPNKILCVRTADCLPVLAWGSGGNIIAAVHAGWRGLSKGIVKKGIGIMKDLGARDIEIFLGPAIGPCCFEVSYAIGKKISPTLNRHINGSYYIDLWEVASYQAHLSGIPFHKIHTFKICTSCYKEMFFSYRGDGASTGRNISVIGGNSWLLPGLRAG